MIAVLLSVIIASGIFLGIILSVFVFKSRSTHIACYHKTNSLPKDELEAFRGIPDEVDINRAYGIGKCESDDSSYLRVTANNNTENDYAYVDCSVHPQECTREGKLDETKTTTNQQYLLRQDCYDERATSLGHTGNLAVTEIHHTLINHSNSWTPEAPHGGNCLEGDSIDHPLPVPPQKQAIQENEVQERSSCADEYIEIHHKSGTLV